MKITIYNNKTHSGGSDGKEPTCKLGDLGLIPGLGRSPGEGIYYPLQYSWASLVGQTVKNLPAMLETWVLSLGWEEPLEEGIATHSSILAWRIPMDRGAWQATVHGTAKSKTQLSDFHFLSLLCYNFSWNPSLYSIPSFSGPVNFRFVIPEE